MNTSDLPSSLTMEAKYRQTHYCKSICFGLQQIFAIIVRYKLLQKLIQQCLSKCTVCFISKTKSSSDTGHHWRNTKLCHHETAWFKVNHKPHYLCIFDMISCSKTKPINSTPVKWWLVGHSWPWLNMIFTMVRQPWFSLGWIMVEPLLAMVTMLFDQG